MKRHILSLFLMVWLPIGMQAVNYKIVKQEINCLGGTITGTLVLGTTNQYELIATPKVGYEFVRWTDDATLPATRTITKRPMNEAVTDAFSAVFKKTADLTDDYGEITIKQTSATDDEIVYTLTANPKGCASFFKWNDNYKVDNIAPSTRTYTIGQDCRVYALYRNSKIGNENTPATGGSITLTPGFCENTLTAVPNTYYVFYQWVKQENAKLTHVSDETSITVDFAAETYQAQFIPDNLIRFALTDKVTGTQPTDAHGVQREAPTGITAKEHYTFDGWKDGENNIVTFPYFCAGTLTASCTATQYTISFDVDGKAEAIEAKTGTIESPITLPTATPKTGWQFDGWKVGGEGELLAAGAEYTPHGNVTMIAQYIDVATIRLDDDAYTTLAEAMENAQAQSTLYILNDVTEDLNIPAEKAITVQGNGHTIGSITIAASASLSLSDQLTATDLFLQSEEGASSQLFNASNLTLTRDAYIDITLEKGASQAGRKWFAFAVPFEVNTEGGGGGNEHL